MGPATLAAELYAAAAGADFIRTHDPAALCDGLKIVSALHVAESRAGSDRHPHEALSYCAGGGGSGVS